LPATLFASTKESVACTLGSGGVPLTSTRSRSVPRRVSGADAEAGGMDAAAGLRVEEQEATRRETARNEAAACFMGPPSGIKNDYRKF